MMFVPSVIASSVVVLLVFPQGILSSEVSVEYQIGFQSQNDGSYKYVLSCKADGRFLRWQLGNDILGGFRGINVGRTIVDRRQGYRYTAVLLSSEPVDNQRYQQDSVLIVSTNQLLNNATEVACTTNSNSSATQVREISQVAHSNSSDNGEVVLDLIISRPIVLNSNYHIYICATNSNTLDYNLNSQNISFTRHNVIGSTVLFLSEDNRTANILSVLIGRRPSMRTAILLVTGNSSDVSVTCSDENNQAELTSMESITTTPMQINITSTPQSQNPESSPSVTLSVPTSRTEYTINNVSSTKNNGSVTRSTSAPLASSVSWLGLLILILFMIPWEVLFQ